jgi:hypothetical protein
MGHILRVESNCYTAAESLGGFMSSPIDVARIDAEAALAARGMLGRDAATLAMRAQVAIQ